MEESLGAREKEAYECFWSLLKRDANIYPGIITESRDMVRTKKSRMDTIEVDSEDGWAIIPEDDGGEGVDDDAPEDGPMAFSSDVTSLVERIRARHPRPKRFSETAITSHFRNLRLNNLKIKTIHPDFRKFTNLEYLSLVGNQLTELCNLPSSVKQLSASSNCFEEIPVLDSPENIVQLSLGYNLISTPEGVTAFSNVLSLDLSWNNLTSLYDVLSALQELPHLAQLWLTGNPLTLVMGARFSLVESLPDLRVLDDLAVTEEERQAVMKSTPPAAPAEEATVELNIDVLKKLPAPVLLEPEVDEKDLKKKSTEKKKPAPSGKGAKGAPPEPENPPAEEPEEPAQPQLLEHKVTYRVLGSCFGEHCASGELVWSDNMNININKYKSVSISVRLRDAIKADGVKISLLLCDRKRYLLPPEPQIDGDAENPPDTAASGELDLSSRYKDEVSETEIGSYSLDLSSWLSPMPVRLISATRKPAPSRSRPGSRAASRPNSRSSTPVPLPEDELFKLSLPECREIVKSAVLEAPAETTNPSNGGWWRVGVDDLVEGEHDIELDYDLTAEGVRDRKERDRLRRRAEKAMLSERTQGTKPVKETETPAPDPKPIAPSPSTQKVVKEKELKAEKSMSSVGNEKSGTTIGDAPVGVISLRVALNHPKRPEKVPEPEVSPRPTSKKK
eukprot:Rmarinus@m.4559